MNENHPPSELPEGFLLAYLEGMLDDADRRLVEQALTQDAELRHELDELAITQEGLVRQLAQAPASTQELGEYLLGMLAAERAAAVEARLASDAALRGEADALRDYLARPDDLAAAATTAQVPGLLDRLAARVNLIVAEVAQGLAGPALAPMPLRGEPPAGTAGSEGQAARPLTYQAGDGQVLLEVQPGEAQPNERTLLGLLLGFDQPETLTTHLYSGEREVATAPCTELGNFTLTGLVPGTYDLTLSAATLEILVPGVVIA